MSADEKKVTVIIAAHKKYRMPDDSMYLPVQVGADKKESIGFQRDDEGDNISSLNPSFCELTGLYWAWKNLASDYTGLVHYRRHFSMKTGRKDPWKSVLTYDELKPYLNQIKLFVPRKRKYYIETLYSHYGHTHDAKHLDETRKIISDLYPQYLNTFDETMRQRWGYMFNMMIAERSILDSYCTWLFAILFRLRGKFDETDLTAFDARYYGRVSELLFNVWINQELKTGKLSKNELLEIPVIYMEKINWLKKGTGFLKAKFFGTKYKSSF